MRKNKIVSAVLVASVALSAVSTNGFAHETKSMNNNNEIKSSPIDN